MRRGAYPCILRYTMGVGRRDKDCAHSQQGAGSPPSLQVVTTHYLEPVTWVLPALARHERLQEQQDGQQQRNSGVVQGSVAAAGGSKAVASSSSSKGRGGDLRGEGGANVCCGDGRGSRLPLISCRIARSSQPLLSHLSSLYVKGAHETIYYAVVQKGWMLGVTLHEDIKALLP